MGKGLRYSMPEALDSARLTAGRSAGGAAAENKSAGFDSALIVIFLHEILYRKVTESRGKSRLKLGSFAGHGKDAVPGVGRFLEQVLLAPLPVRPRGSILGPLR